MGNNRKRMKKQRQEWNPHWILKILYGLWMTAFGIFKIAVGAVATVLMICLVCGFVVVGILGDYLESDILPEAADYEFNISDLEQTSYVYYVDSNGEIQLLQQLYTTVDRQWVSIEDIPENLINAAVAIEDKRFYEHQGVDWLTTIKACANMFMGGDSTFGGSTITQQLVKNQTGENSVTVQRKVMEIFRAMYVEKLYDKDTIMEYYLNTIYFGRGCYGVKSAAEEYFGKELQSLTLAECASLISITNNPSLYNPYSESEYEFRDLGMTTGVDRNRYRQLNVLEQMLEQEMITQEEYDEAVAQEMVFKSGIADEDKWQVCSNESCGYEGTVSTFIQSEEGNYFCPVCGTQVNIAEDASQEVYSYFVDTVLEDVAKDLAALDGYDWDDLTTTQKELYNLRIQQGGYHIYSTLDMDVQNQIDEIYTNLDEIPTTTSSSQLQSAIVVIDNSTGDIVGMSGGVGEKVDHDAFNRATDAKLQTGSSMKPITVYAPGFESGLISPATAIKDMPLYYEGTTGWPKNDNRKYTMWKNVYNGITSSTNAVAVNTLDKIGLEYSYSFATEKLGISTLVREYPQSDGTTLTDVAYSPLALGALTVGATVRDMATAYATFANDGVYREARTYTKVYDSEGNLVLDNTQETYQAMSEKAANYVNYCLYGGANYGTGAAAVFTSTSMSIAGKTGTTSDQKDRWFCGYSGYYTAAVWCGFDTPEVISLTGSTTNPAVRLWKKVMEPLHVGLSNVSVYDSSGFTGYSICLETGKVATAACSKDVRGITMTSYAACYPEDVATETCDQHVLVDYCVTGGGVATEWCYKFEDAEIKEVSLVKLSEEEVEERNAAKSSGLDSSHLLDSYVWYTDGNWHGFDGTAQPDVDAPYIVCSVHTQEAWEELQAQQEAEETDPTEEPTEEG